MKLKKSPEIVKTTLVHSRNAAILGVLAKSNTSKADRKFYLSIIDPCLKGLAVETVDSVRKVPVVKRTKDSAHLLAMSHVSSTPEDRKRHLRSLSPRARVIGKRILARKKKVQAQT